jgi:hypothetical protein
MEVETRCGFLNQAQRLLNLKKCAKIGTARFKNENQV